MHSLSLLITLSFFSATPALAASIAAKKDGVEIVSEPAKGASVVATMKKDEEASAGDRVGMYWKVTLADGKTGFVSVMQVKRQAGSSDQSLSETIRAAAKNGREEPDAVSSTRARSAVMGVRGLDESQRTASAGNVKPNMRMVYQMEDRQVSQKRLEELNAKVSAEVELLVQKGESAQTEIP